MPVELELKILRIVALVVLMIVVIAGSIALWEHLFHPAAPLTEAAAPAVIQADGSHELQRQATAPDAKPLNQLPKGAKLVRSVTVQAKANVPKGAPAGTVEAPVTLKMDLDRLSDGSERAVVSSPDGQIIGGMDIPVAPPAPESPKWAAGVAYGIPIAGAHAEGVWVERDIWRVRLGIEADRFVSAHGSSGIVMARLGVTF